MARKQVQEEKVRVYVVTDDFDVKECQVQTRLEKSVYVVLDERRGTMTYRGPDYWAETPTEAKTLAIKHLDLRVAALTGEITALEKQRKSLTR